MNKVDFFGKQVSKLIVGDNPFTGHSYILEVPSKEMLSYYTSEKILEAMFKIEENGYNTMLPLADPYMIRLIGEYQRAGGKMQFIFQPYMPIDQEVSIRQISELDNVIGIYHQGTTSDYLHETGNYQQIFDTIKIYRELGIPVGLGTHYPELIAKSEAEGWDVDFYLACLHNARRGRRGEVSGFISGKSKAGLIFYPQDRPIMLEQIAKTEKPVIAFKIFGGGQIFSDKTEDEKQAIVKGVYEEVFTKIKPNDVAAIGVFQRDKDQITQNADIYKKWYAEKYGK